jgi:glycosyltransferase involved in cell wall biosynthesis
VLAIHGGRYLIEEFRSPAVRVLATGMLRRAKVVLVLSELEKTEVDRRWPGLDVRVLPNAVPRIEIERPPRGSRPVLAFLGRLHESKGLDEIVAAVKILKSRGFVFQFRAYGEGPQRESFVSAMGKILGQDFEYGGVVSGDEKWAALAETDILVLPSRYGEGLPMSVLEAMAAGCVVVAGDIASVSSVIENGVNGFTVIPGDAEDLTDTVARILSDPAKWTAVGERAAATVRERFDIAGYIARLEDIYREVVA